MKVRAKKIQCNTCEHADYFEDKVGYYCTHPLESEPKLIVKCKQYHMGIRSPRWCIRKGAK